MSIATIVTGGYGNGTFTTTIQEVVTRGYAIGAVVIPTVSDNPAFTLEAAVENWNIEMAAENWTLEMAVENWTLEADR